MSWKVWKTNSFKGSWTEKLDGSCPLFRRWQFAAGNIAHNVWNINCLQMKCCTCPEGQCALLKVFFFSIVIELGENVMSSSTFPLQLHCHFLAKTKTSVEARKHSKWPKIFLVKFFIFVAIFVFSRTFEISYVCFIFYISLSSLTYCFCCLYIHIVVPFYSNFSFDPTSTISEKLSVLNFDCTQTSLNNSMLFRVIRRVTAGGGCFMVSLCTQDVSDLMWHRPSVIYHFGSMKLTECRFGLQQYKGCFLSTPQVNFRFTPTLNSNLKKGISVCGTLLYWILHVQSSNTEKEIYFCIMCIWHGLVLHAVSNTSREKEITKKGTPMPVITSYKHELCCA